MQPQKPASFLRYGWKGRKLSSAAEGNIKRSKTLDFDELESTISDKTHKSVYNKNMIQQNLLRSGYKSSPYVHTCIYRRTQHNIPIISINLVNNQSHVGNANCSCHMPSYKISTWAKNTEDEIQMLHWRVLKYESHDGIGIVSWKKKLHKAYGLFLNKVKMLHLILLSSGNILI